MAEAYHVGIGDLKNLVGKVAIQAGLAVPAKRPKPVNQQQKGKEDGIRKSQKILLTWMIEDESVFRQIRPYLSPSDFSGELYRTVAELLYGQYET